MRTVPFNAKLTGSHCTFSLFFAVCSVESVSPALTFRYGACESARSAALCKEEFGKNLFATLLFWKT